jgi:hypothetical protein
VLRVLAPMLAVAATLGCGPDRPHYDAITWDMTPRDDGGEADGGDTGDAGDAPDADAPEPDREVEDNDPFHGGVAQPVTSPASLVGVIGAPTADRPDSDVFALTGAAGQVIRASAYPTGSGVLDLVVRIVRVDGGGEVVFERIGDDPASVSVHREAFLPESGEYWVVVTDRANLSPSPAAWRGGTDCEYQITIVVMGMSSVPAGDLPWEWTGTIRPMGMVQGVRFAPPAGEWIEAAWSTTDEAVFDPFLTVFDESERRVLLEADDGGTGLSALVRFEASGNPLLLVLDHVRGDGARYPPHVLRLRSPDPGTEAEPNDRAASAVPLSSPADVRGTIDSPRWEGDARVEDRDLFRFEATASVSYAVSVSREGSPLDPWVSVRRRASPLTDRLALLTPLSFADDSPRLGDRDARVVVTADAGGDLYVEVRDARNVAAEREGREPADGGTDHGYRLRIETATAAPPVDLGMLDAPRTAEETASQGGVPDGFRARLSPGQPFEWRLADRTAGTLPFAPLAWMAAPDGTVPGRLSPAGGSSAGFGWFGADAGGFHRVEIGDGLGSGREDFLYRFEWLPLAAEAVVEAAGDNDADATAQPLAWSAPAAGVVVVGSLDRTAGTGPDPRDVYRVEGAAGERLLFFTGSAGATTLDTVLVVRREDGTVAAESDDVAGGSTLFSSIVLAAEEDAPLFVEVSPWGTGAAAGYRLFVGAP